MPHSHNKWSVSTSQGSLCVAGPHVVAPKSPPVVLWFEIGCYPNRRLPCPIAGQHTTGGDLGATTWGSATHMNPCDLVKCQVNLFRITSKQAHTHKRLHDMFIHVVYLVNLIGIKKDNL